MQTHFTPAQLADPQVADTDRILRACVHCGFCTATCPTYLLTGDELDSPRGRIYLAKDMLEKNRPADATTVKHLDRCLTCLSCMTTCPSGVHYMHLVDHARQHIERTYRRPLSDRFMRAMLAFVLPHTSRFRAALMLARLVRPMRALFPKRVQALLDAAGGKIAAGSADVGSAHARAAQIATQPSTLAAPPRTRVVPATALDTSASRPLASQDVAGRNEAGVAGARRIRRVALLPGCVQPALRPEINEATLRVLERFGVEVIVAPGTGCCGALVHHLGREHESSSQAKADIDAWTREIETRGLDAIIVTASGCGTMLKDYGFLFRTDPQYAAKAARVSALSRDISEVLAELMAGHHFDVEPPGTQDLRVAYHSACSLQHGQKLHALAPRLLREVGFAVLDIPESHICCGSAGTYSMLQPEMSAQLRDRKARNIESVRPDVIATGNIGCITQIAQATGIPIVHTVELLDWATGGPPPARLAASQPVAAREPRAAARERPA
ncbi:MAG: heterodisulfide reductase-related iron-sulfur binding cluster [Gammaproteobacteria bacterium]